ncbi:MAG: 4Fe-4S ferredoxin [Deltaproteobacteria bacterium]|nr:4Fe-4S ferredoxin [Deltaproteobacteria bacterium]
MTSESSPQGLDQAGSALVNTGNREDRSSPFSDTGTNLISAEDIRRICLEAGAYDAGFVDINRESLAIERNDILRVYPRTRTIISVIQDLNRETIQSPARYLSTEEFYRSSDDLARISRTILRRLNQLGIRGVAMTGAFPMDMNKYPGKIWDVSHKLVAVAAGRGHMGINRLVLHPKCGSCIELNSILIDAELDRYDHPLAQNPCSDCRLCVAVCPVGAISRDKPFDFMACMTHSYRDNSFGFLDWIDAMISSADLSAYRSRFRDSETASMWQSLMYKMDFKCGCCMAVCPAGQDIQAGFQERKAGFIKEIFRPLKDRKEPIYVVAGSEAEVRARRNPNKEIRYVGLSPARRI